MKTLLATTVVVLLGISTIRAQDPDTLLLPPADSTELVLSLQDSLDILDLIDSMLLIGPITDHSMLAVRLGYNSNIVADNRSFNIDKFGLAPGVSYYHKSGAYADLTTYWSKEYDPSFYLTVTSAGYMHQFGKWYTLLTEYSHYFYSESADSTLSVPYTNNLAMTNFFEWRKVVFRLDYYFYFGDKTAHRIQPGIGMNFVKRKWLGFDRVSFYPMVNVLFGSEQTTTYEVAPNVLLRLLYNRTHSPKLPLYYENTITEFGVMNYSFTAPIYFTRKNWNFMLGYTYNIPKSLPNEELSLQNSGYLSFTITRFFDF